MTKMEVGGDYHANKLKIQNYKNTTSLAVTDEIKAYHYHIQKKQKLKLFATRFPMFYTYYHCVYVLHILLYYLVTANTYFVLTSLY